VQTSILVGYATRYGTTLEAANVIATALRTHGVNVDVHPLREVRSLVGYSAVIMGAPLFMFHWHKDALRFLTLHRHALSGIPVAVFALGPIQNPHDIKEWSESRAQLEKELTNYPWLNPVAVELFGGKYDPANLGFPLKLFAGQMPGSDARDLEVVRAWAESLTSLIKLE
jgi:menaquinone-dependent protoporphyrinogen oxidase